MPWVAILNRVIPPNEGQLAADVTFTDNVSLKVREVIPLEGLTAESFKARLRSRLAQLEPSFNFQKVLQPGLIDVTPADPDPLTPAQLARQAYERAYASAARAQQAVAIGVWTADDKVVTDRIAAVVALRQEEYLDA